MEGWGKIKPASRYAGVSDKTLRTWLKNGLRHARLPSGMVLIKYTWLDEFIKGFEDDSENEANRIVDSLKI